jgi:hypothetical protein
MTSNTRRFALRRQHFVERERGSGEGVNILTVGPAPSADSLYNLSQVERRSPEQATQDVVDSIEVMADVVAALKEEVAQAKKASKRSDGKERYHITKKTTDFTNAGWSALFAKEVPLELTCPQAASPTACTLTTCFTKQPPRRRPVVLFQVSEIPV